MAASNLKRKLFSIPLVRNFNALRYDALSMVYDPAHLTPEYYERVKTYPELEHQIGRLQNFRQIIQEITEQKLRGDLIEFGTWRGFSLLWIAFFCQRSALFDRTLIGVDGFLGLPNGEGVFRKGQFKDISRKQCERGLLDAGELYPQIKKNIRIYQSLFREKEKMASILRRHSFVFIHLDADLSSSTGEILERLKENNALADTCFLLFDDYGCGTGLSDVVDNAMSELQQNGWKISVHSSTVLTKNFKLERK